MEATRGRVQPNLMILTTVGHEVNRPDPSGTASVFRRIGYGLDEALADLIDNSVDANATQVLIRFVRDSQRLRRVIIADDGDGMSEPQLKAAMQYGVRVPHQPTDLGKYGIGLKAASFSQCQGFSVITKRAGMVAARRWTVRGIEQDWRQEVLDAMQAEELISQPWGTLDLSASGTLIIWDELDSVSHSWAGGGVEATISGIFKALPPALGLKFHRFIRSGRLTIILDTVHLYDQDVGSIPVGVQELDPFGYSATGRKGFPLAFTVEVDHVPLSLVAHIWPPKSKQPNYKLGGGNVAARQGFFFYRNDRLIQAGGWNGLQNDTEPHYSLARVCVDLPPALDSTFQLSVQKSRLVPPHGFTTEVARSVAGTTTFRDYLITANEVYRAGRQDTPAQPFAVALGKGVPSALARRVNPKDKGDPAQPVDFAWGPLLDDQFFDLDHGSDRIVLNQVYRRQILGSNRASPADAPLIKCLLFLLLRDHVGRRRSSRAHKLWLDECNRILVAALRVQNG